MKLILLLSLVKLCYSQADVTPVIVCCECVPFFLCENGTINTDGGGILDVRIGGEITTPAPAINVEVCPGQVDICCQVPDVHPSCLEKSTEKPATEKPKTYVTPHPNSNCECVVYDSCDPALVVSDGLGKTSIELSNGRLVTHSKCSHSLDVCCYLPEIFLGNLTDGTHSTPHPLTSEKINGECECVPDFLCDPNGYIRSDGAGVLDLRIGPPKPQKLCPHNPNLLCCLPPPSDTTPTEPSTTLPPPPTSCGKRNFNGIGVRVLGFKEGQTQFGEFPWVATLLKKEHISGKEFQLFVGGASLIHPRVVMTAAHKIKDVPVDKLVIRLGEWDTASTKETLPYQDVSVEKAIFHQHYTPGPLFHDVALLILKEEAKVDFHIAPVCLAKSLDDVIPTLCVINGWGVEAFKSENYQKIMKSVTLPLVRKGKCQELLRKTRLSKYFRLHQSFICAGGEEGVDACKGDGGGPLSCPSRDDPTKYLQVGITAWGVGCGNKDVPGVYVDVAFHYNWITNHVNTLFPKTPATDRSLISTRTKKAQPDAKAVTTLSAKDLDEFLKGMKEMIGRFVEKDPDMERGASVTANVMKALTPYEQLYQELLRMRAQHSITKGFQPIPRHNAAATTIAAASSSQKQSTPSARHEERERKKQERKEKREKEREDRRRERQEKNKRERRLNRRLNHN